MSDINLTNLGILAAAIAGAAVFAAEGDHTLTATVTGSGTVSATVAWQGSNDGVGWITIATLAPSGTAVGAAQASTTTSYRYWRQVVGALTGTGAQISSVVATEAASGQAAAPVSNAGNRTPTRYLGQCTDSIQMPNAYFAGNTQILSRKRHKLQRGGASFVQAMFPNFATVNNTSGVELSPGGAATITAYLVVGGTTSAGAITGGTIYPVTWSGASSVVAPDGGMTPLHDPIYINKPKGTVIWYQIGYQNAAGIVYNGGVSGSEAGDPTNGEIFRIAASGFDLTQINTMAAWTGGTLSTLHTYGPCAVVTQRTDVSVFIAGHSIQMGLKSSADNGGNKGLLARALAAAEIPYISVAQGGMRMTDWTTASKRTNRAQLEQYCSHVIADFLINDLIEGPAVDNTVLAARFAALLATFTTGKPTFACATTPYTTGPWTAADGSDQALVTLGMSLNTRRSAANPMVRAGLAGYAGFFDLAAATCLPGTTDTKWYANGTATYMTPDGLHPNAAGETYCKDSGVLDFSALVRV
ncbi:MAG: hypothetical protein EOO80_03085 [Oxalobacteraceae bacterium]|nr:MAG: hypothetical protein EOO80_03085 [Oxalobacteraceae bacterium]